METYRRVVGNILIVLVHMVLLCFIGIMLFLFGKAWFLAMTLFTFEAFIRAVVATMFCGYCAGVAAGLIAISIDKPEKKKKKKKKNHE